MAEERVGRAPPAIGGPANDDAVRAARASILMVDDQPARLLSYEAILAGLGVRCVRALSGAEALEWMLKESFAVVLLDVCMPGMDGFEVARHIREHPRLALTPIIFVTGVSFTEADQLKGYAVGAIDYIPVPVTPEVLRSKVAILVELFERRCELEELTRAAGEARATGAPAPSEPESDARGAEEHRFQQITESIPQLVWSARPDGFSDYYNRRFQEYLGLTREEIQGWTWTTTVHPDDLAGAREAWSRAVATGEDYATELRIRQGKEGPYRWHAVRALPLRDSVGNIARWFGTCTDIDDRRRAEEALQLSERRLRSMIENAPIGVCYVDMSGRFEYVNRAFCDLVGYGAEELLSLTWQQITHRDDVETDQALATRSISYSPSHYNLEKRYIRKDGQPVWVHLFGNFVRDDEGRAVQAVALVIDIAKRRATEEALKESDRRKDEFLAMLAHELRNPVAPIRTSAELLLRLLESDPPKQALAEVIDRQAMQLARLLDDLLDVARITQGRIELKREILSVPACIAQALEAAQPAGRAHEHRVTLIHTSEPLFVHADRARLVQCVSNLLSNALKYTPVGGQIEVRSRAEGRSVVIEVSDDGIGISPDLLPRVFDLFVQAERSSDRTQGGLGIGLSVCRQLIEMHDGTITAESPGTGGGATFRIRLPMAQEPAAEAETVHERPTSPRRILIVDDNHDAANTLSLLLQLEGHETRTVYTAAEALEQMASFAPQFVLLDIGLPGMDGYEAARRIRAGYPAMRIVALSGYGQAEDRRKSAEAGFNHHLVKPVDLANLAAILADPP